MNLYRVSFFGHRVITDIIETERKIEQIARELIRTKEFVEFQVGRNGDFDIVVASAIKRAQKALGKQNSALILVLPYTVKDTEYYEKFYDEIVLPVPPKTHFKRAITRRNEWMVENSDLVVAYVERKSGGAYSAFAYAEKLKISMIKLK